MKNVLIRFLSQFSILVLITGCSNQKANYYQKVKLDGRYEIVGEKPIDDSIYMKMDCYHFKYNQEGKVDEIIYLEKGKPSTDDYFNVSKLKIDYQDGFEERSFYDKSRYPKATYKGVY